MSACSGTKAVSWPGALTRSDYAYVTEPTPLPTKWTQVTWDSGINVTTSDFGCIPTAGGTGSPNEMTGIHVAKPSSSVHTLTWSAVSGANSYMVELQVLKGSTWSVPCSPFVTKGCTYGFITVAATSAPKDSISGSGKYRIRVSAHNSVGWSRVSDWVSLS